MQQCCKGLPLTQRQDVGSLQGPRQADATLVTGKVEGGKSTTFKKNKKKGLQTCHHEITHVRYEITPLSLPAVPDFFFFLKQSFNHTHNIIAIEIAFLSVHPSPYNNIIAIHPSSNDMQRSAKVM